MSRIIRKIALARAATQLRAAGSPLRPGNAKRFQVAQQPSWQASSDIPSRQRLRNCVASRASAILRIMRDKSTRRANHQKSVEPFAQKYFASLAGQISGKNSPSHPTRGADRDRHERAVRCGGRCRHEDERGGSVRRNRVVLTPVGWRHVASIHFGAATVATELGSPGRAHYKP